jgi:hypothetical protein
MLDVENLEAVHTGRYPLNLWLAFDYSSRVYLIILLDMEHMRHQKRRLVTDCIVFGISSGDLRFDNIAYMHCTWAGSHFHQCNGLCWVA